MPTRLFAAALLLIISQAPDPLRAQNAQAVTGTIEIKGSRIQMTGELIDASSILSINKENIKSKKDQPLIIYRLPDAGSKRLTQAMDTHEVLPEVTLKVVKPGDTKRYKTIKLRDATITSFNLHRGSKLVLPTEVVEFRFKAIEIEYTNNGSTSAIDDWTANDQ